MTSLLPRVVLVSLALAFMATPREAAADRQLNSLEKFPISKLKIWHVRRDPCGYHAAVLDPEGYVHTVMAGDYMGDRDGKIMRIDYSGMDVVELVPDGSGGWLERARHLENPSRSEDEAEQ